MIRIRNHCNIFRVDGSMMQFSPRFLKWIPRENCNIFGVDGGIILPRSATFNHKKLAFHDEIK